MHQEETDRRPKPTIAVVSAVAFWEKVITQENTGVFRKLQG